MDRRDLEHFSQFGNKCLHSAPKSPVWIIEHAWAHGMMDILEGVDPSLWPEVAPESLTLKEAWALRVAASQAYATVKTRDIGRFEGVIEFLETTYRLLPRLVVPIKHMKIVFGLKTMIIMWMLREDRSCVNTVVKTIQFFPSKLPQYQDHCSPHEMFLMRKNQQDFKAFAQSLAVDKTKLEIYVKSLMEEQYGERYAQKVEERLIHYLQQLEAAVAQDTYVDKLLRREHPMTKEEELLLEVITCDSTHSLTSLKSLLHSALPSTSRSCPSSVSQQNITGQGAESGSASSSSEEAARNLSKDSPLLLEDEEEKREESKFRIRQMIEEREEGEGNSEEQVRSQQRTVEEKLGEEVEGEADEMMEVEFDCGALGMDGANGDEKSKTVRRTQEEEEEREAGQQEEEDDVEEMENRQRSIESVREISVPPLQLCSKHQRWVRSILQECSEECSEDPQLQRDVTTSPMLLLSSSSTSSSQDLTPSLLIPTPSSQHLPSAQTSTPPQAADQVSPQTTPMDKLHFGSPAKESLPQLSTSRDMQVATLSSPAGLLKPSTSSDEQTSTFHPELVAPTHVSIFSNGKAVSTFQPQLAAAPNCNTSGNEEAAFTVTKTMALPNSTNTTYKLTLTCPPPIALPQSTSVIIPMSEQTQQSPTHKLPVTHPQTDPQSQPSSTSVNCLLPIRKPLSRLSRKSRQASTATQRSQAPHQTSYNLLPEQSGKAQTYLQTVAPQPPTASNLSGLSRQASTSTPQSGTQSWHSTANQVLLSNKYSSEHSTHLQPHLNPLSAIHQPPSTVLQAIATTLSPLSESCAQVPSLNPPPPQTPPYSTAISPFFISDGPEAGRSNRTQLRLSLQSQALLLQSNLLQPCVRLSRLSRLSESCAQAPSLNPPPPETPLYSTAISPLVMSDRPDAGRSNRTQQRWSLQSQALLVQSNLLQPCVRLSRLSQQECHGATEGKSSMRFLPSEEEEGGDVTGGDDDKEEEEGEEQRISSSQLDMNILYLIEDSLSSDEDLHGSDPDYTPHIKRTYKMYH